MKKTLVGLFTLAALSIGIQASFAACPCAAPCNSCMQSMPCNPCCDPCAKFCCDPCCEDWLNCKCVEDYLCRIGLNECQKAEARCAIEQFKCNTQCIRANGCNCESKCDCRTYRKALRCLDCKIKAIITKCQKSDYKYVRSEIKDKVSCCHKCLINPFYRCKCDCPTGCGCNCGCCK